MVRVVLRVANNAHVDRDLEEGCYGNEKSKRCVDVCGRVCTCAYVYERWKGCKTDGAGGARESSRAAAEGKGRIQLKWIIFEAQ